jgi:uncharacterized protein
LFDEGGKALKQRRLSAVLVVSTLGICAGLASGAASLEEPRDTEKWRAEREARLRAPDGYLSIVGLFLLRPGENRVGSSPESDIILPAGSAPEHAGRLVYEEGRVFAELLPGTDARLNDQALSGRIELRPAAATGKASADRLTIGRVTLQLHRSGPRLGVRLRDPKSEFLENFAGLRWYPIQAAWRLSGRFIPYESPRRIQIQNVLGDIEDSLSPGEVEVTIAGTVVRLVAVASDDRLWFIFRDETANRGETYRIRFLYADVPGPKGAVTLDFNRAYNAPCAFNPHTTCPLPPHQNRLKVAIPAGEKAYIPAKQSSQAVR